MPGVSAPPKRQGSILVGVGVSICLIITAALALANLTSEHDVKPPTATSSARQQFVRFAVVRKPRGEAATLRIRIFYPAMDHSTDIPSANLKAGNPQPGLYPGGAYDWVSDKLPYTGTQIALIAAASSSNTHKPTSITVAIILDDEKLVTKTGNTPVGAPQQWVSYPDPNKDSR